MSGAGGRGPGGPPGADELAGPERIFAFADRLRQGDEEEPEPERLRDWVAFAVSGRACALPVEQVREVLRVGALTDVPGAPFPVIGAVSVRGRVLPVVDLGQRLGWQAVRVDEHSRILVLDARGRQIGLLVDEAHRLVKLAPSGVEAPPPDLLPGDARPEGTYALGRERLILLDGEKILLMEGTAEEG